MKVPEGGIALEDGLFSLTVRPAWSTASAVKTGQFWARVLLGVLMSEASKQAVISQKAIVTGCPGRPRSRAAVASLVAVYIWTYSLGFFTWILYLVNTWFCFGILFLSKTPTSQSRFLSVLDQLEPQFPYL